ncbi:abortive infection system antitoxin AbiGi family protein [Ekhidna sp. MALMAid0563]|uniref:abortive infection system antitoxin AbiGi family protein n=1 Tax=Ekhidna sp. MALMAid0563 TaxID=3143937 RepID=UPI0032E01555
MKAIGEVLSSDTFFHFTSKREYLEGILQKTFRPRYCLEEAHLFPELNNLDLAFPMVCFCDIPLSKLRNHINTYGSYGIGLKKEWGFSNGFSPVSYVKAGSKLQNSYRSILNYWAQNPDKFDQMDRLFVEKISEIIMFTKPYEGQMQRGNDVFETKFYDEKEWRWIPDTSDYANIYNHIDKEMWNDSRTRNLHNKRVSELALRFRPDDINYLIIESENEIDDFIQSLENAKERFDTKTIKRLTTRILTKDRIEKDF